MLTHAVRESIESWLAAITPLSREVLFTQARANLLVTNLVLRASRITAAD